MCVARKMCLDKIKNVLIGPYRSAACHFFLDFLKSFKRFTIEKLMPDFAKGASASSVLYECKHIYVICRQEVCIEKQKPLPEVLSFKAVTIGALLIRALVLGSDEKEDFINSFVLSVYSMSMLLSLWGRLLESLR